jgi:hypothetical protein
MVKKGVDMPICKVCKQDLDISKFSNSYATNKKGERKAYKDSTCMSCRRAKYLLSDKNKETHRKGSSNWYKNNPDKVKEQRLRKYGLSYDQYRDMREAQGFSCAICEKNEKDVPQGRASKTEHALHVDHCHSTNTVRALLCTNCNTILGKCYDDVSILEKAIHYLNKHKKEQSCENST